MRVTISTPGVYMVRPASADLKFNGLPLSAWDKPLIPAGAYWQTLFEVADTIEGADFVAWLGSTLPTVEPWGSGTAPKIRSWAEEHQVHVHDVLEGCWCGEEHPV